MTEINWKCAGDFVRAMFGIFAPRVDLVRPSSVLIVVLIGLSSHLVKNEAYAHSPHDDAFDVKASPKFAGDNSVYAVVRSNFLVSRDGGESWQRVVKGLDHKHILSKLDIANDATTLYLASMGDGIYRSTDSGESWVLASSGLSNRVLDVVSVAPNAADIVLAAGMSDGLYKSTNGGEIWQEIAGPFGKITSISFHPFSNNYVVIADATGSIYASMNGGLDWDLLFRETGGNAVTSVKVISSASSAETVLFGTAHGQFGKITGKYAEIIAVDVAPGQDAIVSIAVGDNIDETGRMYVSLWDAGVYCSNNFGSSWADCSNGLTKDRQSSQLGRPSFSELAIAGRATDKDYLFLAGYDGVFRSHDEAHRWSQLDTLSTTNIVGLAVSPNHDTDGKVYLTNWLWGAHVSDDGAGSWRSINEGAIDYLRREGVTRLFNIVLSPDFSNDKTAFSSTWYRLLKSTDGGENWRQIALVDDKEWNSTHHGLIISVSPKFAIDNTVYVGTHRGAILASTDRGESFRILKNVENVIGGIVGLYDSERKPTIYVGDSFGVHVSRDGGESWQFTRLVAESLHSSLRPSPALPNDVARAWISDLYSQRQKEFAVRLAASPAFESDNTIFAGTPNGLFVTTDGGIQWHVAESAGLSGQSFIESVSISPDFSNDKTVLVSVRGRGLYRSADGGKTFTQQSRTLLDEQILFGQYVGMIPKFSGIVFSPTYSADKTVYGFSGPSLLRSVDSANTWQQRYAPKPSWVKQHFVEMRYRYKQAIPGKWYKSKKVWAALILIAAVFALTARLLVRQVRLRAKAIA